MNFKIDCQTMFLSNTYQPYRGNTDSDRYKDVTALALVLANYIRHVYIKAYISAFIELIFSKNGEEIKRR